MKRYGNLYDNLCSLDNLFLAARKAARGKGKSVAAARFLFRLEPEVFALHRELCEGTYRPGQYHNFRITEPKPRLISAAPLQRRIGCAFCCAWPGI